VFADGLLNQVDMELQVVSARLESLSRASTALAMESNLSWPFFAIEGLFPPLHGASSTSSAEEGGSLLRPSSISNILHHVSLGVFVGQDDQEEWINHLQHSAIHGNTIDLPACAHTKTESPDPSHLTRALCDTHIWEIAAEPSSTNGTTHDEVSEWTSIPTADWPSIADVDEEDSQDLAFVEALQRMLSYGQPVISRPFGVNSATKDDRISANPKSLLLQPIFAGYSDSRAVPGISTNPIVGYWKAHLDWLIVFDSMRKVEVDHGSFRAPLLRSLILGALMDVDSTCGKSMTFELIETFSSSFFNFAFLGYDDDLHREARNNEHDIEIQTLEIPNPGCNFSLGIHQSRDLLLAPAASRTGAETADVGLVLGLVTLALLGFLGVAMWASDWSARKREAALRKSATRSMAVVHSLFPETVRDRILEEGLASSRRELAIPRSLSKGGNDGGRNTTHEEPVTHTPPPPSPTATSWTASPSSSHKTAETQATAESAASARSKPIADFFPSATVLFADVVGFTAWASIREPSQVFALLEAIYDSFDKIGKRKNVFKVEVRVCDNGRP
jgi:hypothetical protein